MFVRYAQQEGFIAQPGQIIGKRLDYLTQKRRADGAFAVGRDPFGSTNAAHGAFDVGILSRQGMARLLVGAEFIVDPRDSVG